MNVFLLFFFLIIITTIIFYFLFGLLVELPVDQSPWKRICTFPPWQLCSLNFNYTVCWKLFWRAHHSLNELYRLFISICSSPKVVLSPWERKNKSDCCHRQLRQIVGVRTSCFVIVLEKPCLKIYLNVIRILWNVPFFLMRSCELQSFPCCRVCFSVHLCGFTMWTNGMRVVCVLQMDLV